MILRIRSTICLSEPHHQLSSYQQELIDKSNEPVTLVVPGTKNVPVSVALRAERPAGRGNVPGLSDGSISSPPSPQKPSRNDSAARSAIEPSPSQSRKYCCHRGIPPEPYTFPASSGLYR